jgi:signal transduction histidine kinase
MVKNNNQQEYENNLLRMIIDQLRRPLLAISNESELLKTALYTRSKSAPRLSGSKKDNLVNKTENLNALVRNSLDLIDSFIWSYSKQGQGALGVEVEPVVLSSVFAEVANELEPYASLYDCVIEVRSPASIQPVIANKDNLKSVLKLISSSLIEDTQSNESEDSGRRIVLATKKSANDVEVGVFSPSLKLTNQELNRARSLVGKASQLMPGSLSSVGVNVMLAEMLEVDASEAQFVLSNYRGYTGFSKKLIKSKQLMLVPN